MPTTSDLATTTFKVGASTTEALFQGRSSGPESPFRARRSSRTLIQFVDDIAPILPKTAIPRSTGLGADKEAQYQHLLAVQVQLSSKALLEDLSKEERQTLRMSRWLIDSIERDRYADALDKIEKLASLQEDLAEYVDKVVRSAQPRDKKK